MSRRPNPAADRAEQNRTTLKNLVKLEGNKTCADCKRNKRMLQPSKIPGAAHLLLTQTRDGQAGI